MRVVRVEEWRPNPAEPLDGLSGLWLNGPTQDHHLDAGVITFGAGSATPRHVHHVGQVFVVLSGEGFVQVGDERTELSAGDIVVTPAGEWHTHGAGPGGPMVHLSVTTGRNELESGSY
jgi:quercetin dioxygenase-like cupin family protein